MNANDLVPIGKLAQQYGVKTIIYGGPGSGKTPLLLTAPRPVILITEPGLLSVRRVTNVPAFEAYTPERVLEFMEWAKHSAEARNFDTIGVDSGSQFAETVVKEELTGKSKSGNKVDGKAAYGNMARRVYDVLFDLYMLRNKHVAIIAKQGSMDYDGGKSLGPYFPGNDLNIKVPHLYDNVLQVTKINLPGIIGEQSAIRCRETFGIMARHRSGNLNEFEPCDLTALFQKSMA